MNLDDMTRLALKLAAAMDAAGVEIVKPTRHGPTITGYEVVAPEAAIGKMLASFGWIVREKGPAPDTADVVTIARGHLFLVAGDATS